MTGRTFRPGFKFKDADLLGMPFQVIVGEKNLCAGKDRDQGTARRRANARPRGRSACGGPEETGVEYGRTEVPHRRDVAESARTRTVVNPYTGAVVEEVCQASEADILEAIAAAVEAFKDHAPDPLVPAVGYPAAIATEICFPARRSSPGLSPVETGKPITYARAEVDRSVFTFTISAEEARRVEGEVIPLDLAAGSEERFGIIRRFPLGPIAAITPFNFPLNLVAHKVGPAIAAGNSIVLKPSSNAPGVALLLGDVILSAGWPAGGVQCRSRVLQVKHVNLLQMKHLSLLLSQEVRRWVGR